MMPVLLPASWAYQVVSNAVRSARATSAASTPEDTLVVSIGNLVVGGSGKTPLAMALAESIAANGGRPVYISRGFGAEAERLDVVTVVEPAGGAARFSSAVPGGVRYLRADNDRLAALVGDEGAMAAGRLPGVPLLFCRDKSAALGAAAMFSPTHAIMDDAFQSWGVPRDVDLVVVDASEPFDDGWSLPAGRLREPPEALERADVVGVVGVGDEADLLRVRAQIGARAGVNPPTFGMRRRLQFETDGREPIAVLSGIGRPGAFERQVAASGVRVGASFRFPDHHRYTARDVEWVVREADARGIALVLTTEKDWVKLSALAPPGGRFGVARLSLEFIGGHPLDIIEKAAE
jgi:tetraacyldisaccharide-1-P 4'-kinase